MGLTDILMYVSPFFHATVMLINFRNGILMFARMHHA